MKGILADNHFEKQACILVENIRQGPFHEWWEGLGWSLSLFADHELDYNVSDRDLWRFCQTNGWVLLTDNRNKEGPDAMETVIIQEGTATSLPVITVSKAGRVFKDYQYRRKAAESLLEFLIDIEHHRGAGRLYVPRSR